MFLGLRMAKGVSREEFRQKFQVELEGIYQTALQKLCREGMLAKTEGRVFLTEKGILVSNYVLSQFLL